MLEPAREERLSSAVHPTHGFEAAARCRRERELVVQGPLETVHPDSVLVEPLAWHRPTP